MLRRFAFTVYDKPTPLARPKVNTKTGRFYLPSSSQEARFQIRAAFLSIPEVVEGAFSGPGPESAFQLLTGPLRLTVTAWLPMPASIPKKRRASALPSKRPDLDNYIKQVEDALQGYAFKDDAQIVTIEARKRYARQDGAVLVGAQSSPCWEIILDEIYDG